VRATWAGEGDAPADKNEMTDDSGKLRLSGLKPGRWRVSARPIQGPSGDRPQPVEQEVDVTDGETRPLTLQMP
jgi:hypothetical protein